MITEADRLLVQQIRSGGNASARAWEELVQRYEGRLRSYVRRRLRDQAITDDVVQETFIGFLNSIANYDDRRDLQNWLFSIASFKVTDQLRKLGRQQYQPGSEADEEQLARTADHKQRAASSIARSKERIELEITAVSRALRDLISGLMSRGDYLRVQVLELLFVKGWGNQQVARHLSIAEQQVANYRFATVKRLCEAMRAAGLPPEVFPELSEPPET